MDELTKNIQNIENNISRYIYKKYIVKQHNIIDNNYKIYLQKIFDVKRIKFRICQQDIIKEDLKRMSISDIAYNFNPTNFKPKDYDILLFYNIFFINVSRYIIFNILYILTQFIHIK